MGTYGPLAGPPLTPGKVKKMPTGTIWTRKLSDEFWTGVVSPLMFSIAGELIEGRMMKKALYLCGREDVARERIVTQINGRVYINGNVLGSIVQLIPAVFITEELLQFLPEEIGRQVLDSRQSLFSLNSFNILGRLFRLDRTWAPFFNYKEFNRKTADIGQVLEDLRAGPPSEASMEELFNRADKLFVQMGDFLETVTWGMLFAYVFLPLTTILSEKWGEDRQGELASTLTVGLDGVKTFEVNLQLDELAEMVEGDERLRELFRERPASEILEASREFESGHRFLERFTAFLKEHGHRLVGRDICHTTWRESPEIVVDLIKKSFGSHEVYHLNKAHAARRRAATRALRRRIKQGALGRPKRYLFSLSLFYNQRYFVIRENMRYFSDMFLEQFRKVYLEIGSRLVLSEKLSAPDDIFYLSKEEVTALISDGVDAQALSKERRADYERFRRIKSPEVIRTGDEHRGTPAPPPSAVMELKGQGTSRGVITGRARVIALPEDFHNLEKGEILVTLYTDPSWTPLLAMAGGLVLEVGGMLSHGSIVAREYGIPAAVGIKDATEIIRTGDRVKIDGRAGSVIVYKTDGEE